MFWGARASGFTILTDLELGVQSVGRVRQDRSS